MHAASDNPRNRSHGSDYENIYSVHCCESLFVLRHTVELLSIIGVPAFYWVSTVVVTLWGVLELVSLTEESVVYVNSVG